jgi:hypothetical protein
VPLVRRNHREVEEVKSRPASAAAVLHRKMRSPNVDMQKFMEEKRIKDNEKKEQEKLEKQQ